MKRLFFVSCMMFMVTNIMAYQSVLVEGRTWSTLLYGGATGIDSIDNRPPTTKLYKVEGDSIINGMTYKKHSGFCLETQFYPDSPNKPEFPGCILKAGEKFKSTTIYKFEW